MEKFLTWFVTPTININTSPKIKMAEVICEYAADYINMGENTEERQNYLNGACTAWNITILDEKDREKAIQHVVQEYKRKNPGVEDVGDFEQDLRTMMKKKLEMFPDIKKIIVDAKLEPIEGTKYQVNVASSYNVELLREVLKKGSVHVIQLGLFPTELIRNDPRR